MATRWTAIDLTIVAVLAAAVVATRVPFVPEVLASWDAINYALALQRFDVSASQPHPPGYLLYIALARLLAAMTRGGAQPVLVAISIGSSAAAVAVLYVLGRRWFGRPAGAIAATLLVSSPAFWFHGEVALPHALDLLVITVAVLLLDAVRRGATGVGLAAVWLGIAGGVRPQSQVFLLPMALYAAQRLPWRERCRGVGLLAVVNLVWLVPLVWLSGGPQSYLATSQAYAAAYREATSVFGDAGWAGLRHNGLRLATYTMYALAGVLTVPLLLPWAPRDRLGAAWRDRRAWMVLLWVMPSVVVYLLFHIGQQGQMLVFLPPLLLAAAWLIAATVRRATWRIMVTASIALVGTGIFLLAPAYPWGRGQLRLLTLDTLRRHDADNLSRLAAIRRQFDSRHTLLVSSSWRLPQYYLPAYRVVPYMLVGRWVPRAGQPSMIDTVRVEMRGEGLTPDAEGHVWVVIFDEEILPFLEPPDGVQTLALPTGGRLAYLRAGAEDVLVLSPERFAIVAK